MTRDEHLAVVNGLYNEIDALGEEIGLKDETIASLRAEVQKLKDALAECQDQEPVPEPEPEPGTDPVPKGTFYRGDDMILSTGEAVSKIWGQYSGPGPVSRVELRADGPLMNGLRQKCRHFPLKDGDRPPNTPGDLDAEREEIGQVNKDTGFVYPVNSRAVTRTWYRCPNIDFSGSGEQRRNIMQMKHSSQAAHGGAGGDPITSAPPLSLKQCDGGVELIERSGDYNGRRIWFGAIPYDSWWEIAYDIRYALQGTVDIYFRREGQTMALVKSLSNVPTIKLNRDRKPMYSTYRVGVYQSNEVKAGYLDVGPVRVERL